MYNKTFDLYTENKPLRIAETICNMKRSFKVGKKFSYNNTGYLILALIIESITNIKFEEYVEKNIFIPLAMNDSEFLSNANKERASGYKNGKVEKIFHHSAFFGCGDIIATTGDLKKFMLALNTGKIIRKDLAEGMQGISATNKLMKYGYGCMITDRVKERGIGHGGSVPNSFSSQISHYVDSDLTIIVLCNDIRSIKKFVPGVLVTQYMERSIYEKIMQTKLSVFNKIIF